MTARAGDTLLGFVNVAWDGGDHAFLLDTKTLEDHQRQGIGAPSTSTPAASEPPTPG